METHTKPLIIGLAGFGVVGGGLCQLLRENADMIRKRAGRDILVRKILVRDPAKARAVAPPEGAEFVFSLDGLLNDPEIEAVVELMGGIEAPLELLVKALEAGKHAVTANKALLAEKGLEIYKLASARGRILRYEASVAGAIPIVSSLKESLAGNKVTSLIGILNGTSNYILSEMTSRNMTFADALRQAQGLGFAEADPSLDIDGHDAAHKLVVLIRLAFGQDYPFASLPVRGIRNLSATDIRLAREFGFRIKLLGQVKEIDRDGKTGLAAGVFPALVHHTFLLARVGGAYNAIRARGNASGPLFFHGKGAGSLPTAGAVLADLVAVARDERPNNMGFSLDELPKATIIPDDEWRSSYYARLMVDDAPGVLRDISGCMAAEGISVAQMIQKAGAGASGVPLVFMTHETTELAMKKAVARALAAGLLREEAVYFRVMDREREE
ncbi:MAG: homoserine dehydrogenase [Desulfovibrio sp.]|nr:homoserine dehydrogenase [Desulfovibrio sp.]